MPTSSTSVHPPPDGLRFPGRDLAVAAVVALVAALVPFHRALHFPFALDDYTFLMQASGLEPAHWTLRRVLSTRVYYGLMLRAFGPQPFAWHVVAFTVHAGISVALAVVARRCGASRWAAWLACGLFAASPVAFTVVYWIACIQELAAGAFLLLAALLLHRRGRRQWWAVAAFAAAMLCKESVLAAPLALLAWQGRRAWRPVAGMLAAGIAIFALSGLHGRMFTTDKAAPYATDYGFNIVTHLATQFVWWAAPWRAYPDRVAAPDPHLLLPALVILGCGVGLVWWAGPRARRPFLLAAVWFVALLLPVLPLRQHAYAYYAYLPQMGFLILAAVGIDRAAARAGRHSRLATAAAGTAVLAAWMLCAGRTARTHESLKLVNSLVPHDSVVRYGEAAGALVRAVDEAHLPAGVRRIVFMCFPEQLGTAAPTPGAKAERGMTRIRKFPLRESLREGRLFALHKPGVEAVWTDTLTLRDESPDTAWFFTSGFNDVARLEDAPRAYLLQAQGQLMISDRAAAMRSLRRVLEIAPGHVPARVLLGALELEAGHAGTTRTLIDGISRDQVPAELQKFFDQMLKYLATPGAVPSLGAGPG